MSEKTAPARREPRWPAIIAILAVGGMYTSLPPTLTIGPGWLLLAVAAAMVLATLAAYRFGNTKLHIILGHITGSVLTGFMLWSLGLLIHALPAHKETPPELLRSAAALWATNVLIFAQWYWRLDAGGPHSRDSREGHTEGAFLFPQMTLARSPSDEQNKAIADEAWSPRFVDYLFLAFNTSTALSPTDVPVLSRWAKGMVMTQASISLIVVVILAGRAVNMM